MNEGALARLELPAVRRLLAERTAFAPGRELAEALFPTSDLREAERLQDETAAARDMLRRSPSSGLRGARDIRDAVRRAKLGGTLDPVQLIAVADTVRAAEHLFADVRSYPPLAARARFARPPSDVAAAIENAIGATGEVLDRASARLGSLRANLRAAQESSGAKVTHDELPRVVADGAQLTQLFQNLVGNAMKFRGDDPPRIHVSSETRDHVWVFTVRDNGIGLDTQYADRIFMMFQRLHNKTEYPGTGIGLAICKKIVDRHGGRIWVESQPGQGCTFGFTLPRPTQGSAT